MRALIPFLLLAGCVGGPTSSEPTSPTFLDVPLPERTLVNECDAQIRVASSRSSFDVGPVDGHRAVFGTRQPDPFFVHLGWPSSDPSTSIGIVWRTDLDTLATVAELTPVGGQTIRVEGASWQYGSAYANGTGDYRVHEIRMCDGLEPGTTYDYRVGGEGHWSPTYRFTTPGPPNSFESFRVAVLGDSRGSYEQWGEILALAEAHDPDFYVFSGDMVDTGSSQSQWDAWWAATGDVLARKVLVPAHGNHEYLAVHYFAQFAMPNNEEWFSIRYGDLHLTSLNDTVRDFAHLQDQADYLDAVFTEHSSAWQAMAHHRTLWSTCTTHGSNITVRSVWGPALDNHGVDLVFAGHNHIYERTVPIREEAEAAPGEGTLYFTTGGAGAPLYLGTERDWFSAALAKTEHYLILDFGPTGVDGVVRDQADNVEDSFHVPRL